MVDPSTAAPPASPAFTASARFDAVICDLDGCLAPETSDPLDGPGLERIAAWNRAAAERRDRPIVTLCTGRPLPFAECLARLIAVKHLPIIAENGVWLYETGTNRYLRDPRITAADLKLVRAATEWVEDTLIPRGFSIQPGKSASISIYHPDHELLHATTGEVRAALDALSAEHRGDNAPPLADEGRRLNQPDGGPRLDGALRISTTWFYINCDLAHVSKATAIDRLTAQTGLVRDRLLGIGDTLPDLKIAEKVGFFACPSNAKAELKPHADFVATRPEVEGVLEVLDRMTDGSAARGA